MRLLRRILLCILLLVPLVTLVHRDELGRWDVQRSAMAGPDEFSYLLMADHFLRGGGLSLKDELGRDTFYPPGYPLMLAGWVKVTGGGELTAFRAHALNATLLCIDTLVAYWFARRMLATLGRRGHRRFHLSAEVQAWLALLVAGVFATNWHVLETSLLVMSEPAFMLATFAWLAVALTWRGWPRHLGQTLAVGLLAVAAWSIRGAGIVCVAATFLYPVLGLASVAWSRVHGGISLTRRELLRRAGAIVLVLLLIVGYQGVLKATSPEKALASGKESANSYTDQLLGGLSDGHRLHLSDPRDYPKLAVNLRNLVLDHFADYTSSFVPWPRENPDWLYRVLIGKIFGWLGLVGWLWHATRLRHDARGARADRSPGSAGAAPPPAASEEAGSMRFLELFVLLYMGLYLIWPFNFARFWSPILPVMLVYGADAVVRFSMPRRQFPAAGLAVGLLALLLALSAIEDRVQLGNYARRLNYVSDALARGVETIMKRAPDPARTAVAAMNGDDHFALAWYFAQARTPRGSSGAVGRQYRISSPLPHVEAKGGAGESVEEMILRLVAVAEQSAGPALAPHGKAAGEARSDTKDWRVYLFSYFAHPDARGVFQNLARRNPEAMARVAVEEVQQQEIISAVWEIRPIVPATRSRDSQ
jgi:hypothetical protein